MAQLSAGQLCARVHFHGPDIRSIEMQLDRPVRALAGLHGKRPADCLQLLPLLFPLCGTAHALAALQAIEAATSLPADPAHLAARESLAAADMLAAQVWRTCIDWAQLAGTPVVPGPVARARKLVERIALAIYPDGDWKRIGGGQLAPSDAALGSARNELRQLREELDLPGATAALRTPMAFALQGTGAEWSARIDDRFAAMVAATAAGFQALDARFDTLAQLPQSARSCAELTRQSGRGSGMARTARGELCYQFDIENAVVQSCGMSAPTDREFRADGPVAQLLQQLRHAADPPLAVRWVLAACDPCIEVRVEAAPD